jgi:hypothetical protein
LLLVRPRHRVPKALKHATGGKPSDSAVANGSAHGPQTQSKQSMFGIKAVLQGIHPFRTPSHSRLSSSSVQSALKKDGNTANNDSSINTTTSTQNKADSGISDATLPQPPSLAEVVASRVADQIGGALSCLDDAACFPQWQNATNATVLLVLMSPSGGRFCTGTLLNSGSDPAQQLILTANHCRKDDDDATIADLWGVVIDYGNQCTTADSTTYDTEDDVAIQTGDSLGSEGRSTESGATGGRRRIVNAAAVEALLTTRVLQGLEVVWADEISDVLILRLLNEIPEEFYPYYLGWDASFFPKGQSKSGWGLVHNAAADVKKLTSTTKELRPVRWKSDEYTHVMATWTNGVTQEGSSGANLVDADTGLAVGVLTVGPEPTNCRNGRDILGTLYTAWKIGLWTVLSPSSADGTTKMVGRSGTVDGPGIIAFPWLDTPQKKIEGGSTLYCVAKRRASLASKSLHAGLGNLSSHCYRHRPATISLSIAYNTEELLILSFLAR